MTQVSGQLTKNFNALEFACHDGSGVPIELKANITKLAVNLQVLRDYVKVPITITSGYRSPSHNKKVKGKSASKHLIAQAADIKVVGMTPKQVAEVIEKLILENRMVQGGLCHYATFVHYDVRGTKARWNG
jgi:uncharacterized protein YcbK (DUF882 family)